MQRKVSRRAWLGLVGMSALAVGAGCGPSWTVVTAAGPNDFARHKTFGIEAVRYEALKVGDRTEAEFLAGKDSAQTATFEEDKGVFAKAFASQLPEEMPDVKFIASPPPSPFVLRPSVTFIEPGFYSYVAARPTEVEMKLEIVSAEGKVLEVVSFRVTVAATMSNASSGGRLRAAGEIMGGDVAEYLRTRIGP